MLRGLLGNASIFSRRSCISLINVTRAGQKHRLSLGLGRSGNEDGFLHDAPDFHFADGRPAPTTSKQREWQNRREREKKRIIEITQESLEHNQRVQKTLDIAAKVPPPRKKKQSTDLAITPPKPKKATETKPKKKSKKTEPTKVENSESNSDNSISNSDTNDSSTQPTTKSTKKEKKVSKPKESETPTPETDATKTN
eukprot:TRINITY_DN731_c0_g5_i1.p1 TRINITY_DN731_c0_g5~~TRINITY_DN731_c0_g5_i1.p1  ORF type:complete len:197 (+),score=56.74 TRINITY_DN731_c0_g5_i1:200-790(+)